MKHSLLTGLILLFSLMLVACATKHYPFPNKTLANETWMQEIETNSSRWLQGTDKWFITGRPSAVEQMYRQAAYKDAISTIRVRVPDFTKIQVNGDFDVQIFGTTGENSVYVYGPNAAVRQVSVEVYGDALCINQVNGGTRMGQRVIIRIGVANLTALKQLGCGKIEGVHLNANHFIVESYGAGNIYLSGYLQARKIVNGNGGAITLLGVNTSAVDIETSGSGAVNLSGNVGLRSIMHHGSGNINIIGVNSINPVNIYTDGSGKIGLKGLRINLRAIRAKDDTCVYVYVASSYDLNAYLSENARVGVAGTVINLSVDAYDSSQFQGRYLCATNAFVRTHKRAHVNVAASHQLFARAIEDSSIYYFGTPDTLSKYTSDQALIVALLPNGSTTCAGLPVIRRQIQLQGEG
jgi:hypothetical protein